MVDTDMGQAVVEPMKDKGTDLSAYVMSVEQSVQGMRNMVRIIVRKDGCDLRI
jgi:hypothetical protein